MYTVFLHIIEAVAVAVCCSACTVVTHIVVVYKTSGSCQSACPILKMCVVTTKWWSSTHNLLIFTLDFDVGFEFNSDFIINIAIWIVSIVCLDLSITLLIKTIVFFSVF